MGKGKPKEAASLPGKKRSGDGEASELPQPSGLRRAGTPRGHLLRPAPACLPFSRETPSPSRGRVRPSARAPEGLRRGFRGCCRSKTDLKAAAAAAGNRPPPSPAPPRSAWRTSGDSTKVRGGAARDAFRGLGGGEESAGGRGAARSEHCGKRSGRESRLGGGRKRRDPHPPPPFRPHGPELRFPSDSAGGGPPGAGSASQGVLGRASPGHSQKPRGGAHHLHATGAPGRGNSRAAMIHPFVSGQVVVRTTGQGKKSQK